MLFILYFHFRKIKFLKLTIKSCYSVKSHFNNKYLCAELFYEGSGICMNFIALNWLTSYKVQS